MKQKKVILLNGLPRSGKDSMADYLVEYHGYQKLSFATPLKQIMASTFDITVEELELYKNSPDTYKCMVYNKYTDFRDILRRFGTEGMKPFFGDDVWAKLTYEIIQESEHDKIVVADFRFLSEYIEHMNIDLSSILVKDERDLPLEGHASDVELYQNKFEFDAVVQNTGTLDDYYYNIEDLSII